MFDLFTLYPLESALMVFILNTILWRQIPEQYPYWRMGIQLVLFFFFSHILSHAGLSPFKAAPWEDQVATHLLGALMGILWWVFAAQTTVHLINTLMLAKVKQNSRFVTDLIGAIIFLFAFVAAAGYVLNLPVKGLLATSGALAIIVGLALQSTLNDVFSGIVLNATKPYDLLDWIIVEGTEGQVIEINWRATHLQTSHGTLAILPNSMTAKARIINLSRPKHVHGVTISLEITPEARPRTVLDALERAIQGCSELLVTPKASTKLKTVNPTSVTYEINGFVSNMSQKTRVANLLYDLAYRHLAASGVIMHNLALTAPELTTTSHRRQLLNEINIFRTLTDEEKIELSSKMVGHAYNAGQLVVKAGELTDYLLIIDSGVISVTLQLDNTVGHHETIEAGRMGPREIIGERGILRGTPTKADLTTLTHCVIYRIEKADLMPFIEASSPVGDALENLLSIREHGGKALLEQHSALPTAPKGLMQWLWGNRKH